MTAREMSDSSWSRIEEIVDRAVAQGQAPGVVAAVAQGDLFRVAPAGVMAVGGGPMQRDSLFRISSMTKPMTAVVVLSPIDDGLLQLDDQWSTAGSLNSPTDWYYDAQRVRSTRRSRRIGPSP